jgi:hypothetical protein
MADNMLHIVGGVCKGDFLALSGVLKSLSCYLSH